MSVSPMMQQYHAAKQAAGDALLLFRMGDFYELFHDDAIAASKLLGLTLTSRDKGENPVPMAGFPHHQLDQYLAKIIASGARAAVCEQVEDPRQAKGIVRREITRVVSRGTVTDDALLDPQASNYLAALVRGEAGPWGLAWLDVSTGRFAATLADERQLADELTRVAPSELVVLESQAELLDAAWTEGRCITRRTWRAFDPSTTHERLTRQLGTTSLEGFGFDVEHHAAHELAIRAAGAVLDYVSETQPGAELGHIRQLNLLTASDTLQIDSATWRSLEITSTLRDGRREGSLLGVLDRTVTGMGARLLGQWLTHPLTSVAAIDERLDAVAELVEHPSLIAAAREALAQVYDMQRLVGRVTTGRAGPRDLQGIAKTLSVVPSLRARLTARSSHLLGELESRLDPCAELRARLETLLADECPQVAREGGFIRAGAYPPLDELRELMRGGKQWMAQYQASESQRTGIPSLKVGFNSVFGYFLEITHAHREKVPAEYIRKQTLKNAERYVTPELKEYEERVLSAEERALGMNRAKVVLR